MGAFARVVAAGRRDARPQEPVRAVLLDREDAHVAARQADVAERLELAALARQVDALHLARGDRDADLAAHARRHGDGVEAHPLVRRVDEDLDRVGAGGDRQLVQPDVGGHQQDRLAVAVDPVDVLDPEAGRVADLPCRAAVVRHRDARGLVGDERDDGDQAGSLRVRADAHDGLAVEARHRLPAVAVVERPEQDRAAARVPGPRLERVGGERLDRLVRDRVDDQLDAARVADAGLGQDDLVDARGVQRLAERVAARVERVGSGLTVAWRRWSTRLWTSPRSSSRWTTISARTWTVL